MHRNDLTRHCGPCFSTDISTILIEGLPSHPGIFDENQRNGFGDSLLLTVTKTTNTVCMFARFIVGK